MTLRYDEENRLVEVSDSTHDSIYTYDGLGRRVEAKVSISGALTSDTLYVYDGRRVVEEWAVPLSTLGSGLSTPTLLRSYTRGLDLSGSLEGAGGIGGLLALSQPVVSSSNPSTFTAANYFYDGNGNVIDLVGDDGSSQAHYQYSPFGETLAAIGPLATVNPYQFSTKENDAFTGFCYYGQRYYNPSTGRWLSREPLGEPESPNLYGFVSNHPTNTFDVNGLYQADGHFYAIFAVARANHMSVDVAYQLAYYGQYPDQKQQLNAANIGFLLTFEPGLIRGQDRSLDIAIFEVLHSLHGGDAQDVQNWRKCLADMLHDGSTLEPWQRGLLTHALGDAFAHTKDDGSAYGPPIGHAPGSAPDIAQFRPGLFGQYIQTLNQALGGHASQGDLNNITSSLTAIPAGTTALVQGLPGHGVGSQNAFATALLSTAGQALRLSNALSYDQARWGYDKSYAPGSYNTDSNMPDLTLPQVQSFIQQIQQHCGCQIKNGSNYK
jgi:RHS repeat-associated protein